MVCEYLPGAEYSVDMLVNRGDTLAHTIRQREKTVSGISVQGTFVADKEISKICRLLASNLDLHGPIGMQFKRDEKGVAKILEINPRLQGAVSTAIFAGINFPLLSVQLANNEGIKVPNNKTGISFNRYWKDIQE
ncbi:MAG: ATP-grasp domain-containing protein, partial [Bacteroidia bacterium]|nr:ATP-grasp domain-containing protein [Bacteroidia bacterium]